MRNVRRHFLRGLSALVVAGCAPSVWGPSGPIAEGCESTGRYKGSFVFEEEERIVAYVAPTRLDQYRGVLPEVFAIPGRPLVRVSVIDFYGMSNGPTYLESEIAVAGVHEGQHGFFVVTMPVTDGDSCAGGRAAWGYPKVVRRITLERQRHGYVGVVYAPGGRVPELTLSLDASRGESGAEAMDVLRRVGPMPSFTLKGGRVLRFGGGRPPVYDLQRTAPTVWTVRLGHATLEFPREPAHPLQQLGVGRPLAAYWVQQRARYSITPS